MSLIKKVLGMDRRFYSQSGVRSWLQEMFADNDEDFIRAEMLLHFEGSSQLTWLSATAEALYCVFDVADEPEPRIKWRLAKERAVQGGTLTLDIEVTDYSRRYGFVKIDAKHKRKYSRELFKTRPVDQSIRLMLISAFQIPL